jgi:hypothetical protein
MTYHASILWNQQAYAAACRLFAKAREQHAKPWLPLYIRVMLAGSIIMVALILIYVERTFPEKRPAFIGISILLGAFLLGALALALLLARLARPPAWQVDVKYQFTEDEFRIMVEDCQTKMPWTSLNKVLMGKKYWMIMRVNANPNELGYLLEVDTLSAELQAFLRSKLPFEEVV